VPAAKAEAAEELFDEPVPTQSVSSREEAWGVTEAPQVETAQQEAAQPVASLYLEGEEAQHRDLDVPAFMRRLKF